MPHIEEGTLQHSVKPSYRTCRLARIHCKGGPGQYEIDGSGYGRTGHLMVSLSHSRIPWEISRKDNGYSIESRICMLLDRSNSDQEQWQNNDENVFQCLPWTATYRSIFLNHLYKSERHLLHVSITSTLVMNREIFEDHHRENLC